jgi:hypothetical protein
VKFRTVHGALALSSVMPMSPRLVTMLTGSDGGVVDVRPVCGGVTGLLAGSVVVGYWQLDPSVAGGRKGGRGLPVATVARGERESLASQGSRLLTSSTTVTMLRTTTTIVATTAK